MTVIANFVSRLGFRSPANSLVGHIDGVFSGYLRGWVDGSGESPVSVILRKNGEVLGQCEASQFRIDLMQKGIRNGRCGFALALLGDPEIQLGDVLEVAEAQTPNRRLLLRMTNRVFNKTLGSVDLVAPDRVVGWVHLPWQPKRRLTVEVRVGNRLVATGPTTSGSSISRLGVGCCGCDFDFELSPVLDVADEDAELSVRCVESGRVIQIADFAKVRAGELRCRGEPLRHPLTNTTSDAVSNSVGNPDSNVDAGGSPEFLRRENERLRAALADRESELAGNRLQLQLLQEEMEHWFLKCLELREKISDGMASPDVDLGASKLASDRKS